MDEDNLTMLLNSRPVHQEIVFTQTLALLDSMMQAPSCHRRAASNLLTSCQSIETASAPDSNEAVETLDNIKALYAARLAVCELTGAGAAAPSQCANIFDSGLDKNGQKDATIARSDRIGPCLTSLESRPQWWTSYSNARQNAVVMCQAARIEVEKGELLDLHRSLTGITSHINKNLADALRRAAEDVLAQEQFLERVQVLRAQELRDMQQDHQATRGLFNGLFQDLESSLGNIMSGILASMKDADADISDLRKVSKIY